MMTDIVSYLSIKDLLNLNISCKLFNRSIRNDNIIEASIYDSLDLDEITSEKIKRVYSLKNYNQSIKPWLIESNLIYIVNALDNRNNWNFHKSLYLYLISYIDKTRQNKLFHKKTFANYSSSMAYITQNRDNIFMLYEQGQLYNELTNTLSCISSEFKYPKNKIAINKTYDYIAYNTEDYHEIKIYNIKRTQACHPNTLAIIEISDIYKNYQRNYVSSLVLNMSFNNDASHLAVTLNWAKDGIKNKTLLLYNRETDNTWLFNSEILLTKKTSFPRHQFKNKNNMLVLETSVFRISKLNEYILNEATNKWEYSYTFENAVFGCYGPNNTIAIIEKPEKEKQSLSKVSIHKLKNNNWNLVQNIDFLRNLDIKAIKFSDNSNFLVINSINCAIFYAFTKDKWLPIKAINMQSYAIKEIKFTIDGSNALINLFNYKIQLVNLE